jgi:F-type H+-transporting ATPase subunit gamma
MQMETALRHLERGSEDMLRLRNRLRQEEIIEEIELMIGGRIKVYLITHKPQLI